MPSVPRTSVLALVMVAACGDKPPGLPGLYVVGGSVSGLVGSGLALRLNGVDTLQVSADGPFAFPNPVASGAAFLVEVGAQPSQPQQVCAVARGSGTVGGGAVTDVAVTCTTAPATVSTLAGLARASGSVDGRGAEARFLYPSGVAVDANGNVFVGDAGNNTIRKITPAGVVTTLAGLAGQKGSADGAGTAARFSAPYGVAVDASGNVYVADMNNHTIRVVTPAGAATTIAGSPGLSGTANGTGGAARFNGPTGVALDAAGNLYVADTGNSAIRLVGPGGAVSTFAGLPGQGGSADGLVGSARFAFPTGVAVDASGNVYVGDTNNGTIRRISLGVVSTLAGTAGQIGSADGAGVAARFWAPSGLAVDRSGNVFVADMDNFTIRKVTPAGAVSTLAGSASQEGGTDAIGTDARFSFPRSVALDSAGAVYVADGGFTIRKIWP